LLRSIQARLAVTYLVVTTVTVLLLGAVLWRMVNNYLIMTAETDLIAQGRDLSRIVTAVPLRPDESVDQLLRFTAGITRTTIMLVNSDGVIVSATRDPSRLLGQRFAVPLMAQAMESNKIERTTFTDPFNELSVLVAIPIRPASSKSATGAIALFQPVSTVRQASIQVRSFLIQAGLLAAGAALIVSLFLVRTLSKPIKEVTEASARLAAGDLEHRVNVHGTDEVAKLADTFNFMADNMQRLIGNLTEERARMSAVLSSVVDPVLAISSGGEVIFSNRAGERMLSESADRGDYKAAIANAELANFVGRALQADEPMVEPITFSDHEYYVATSARWAEYSLGGAVILLRDVSRERVLDKMRRDFISSISHELRTPVTSIAGFVEALEDGLVQSPEDEKRYLTIIADETRRLNRLINDLFDFSKMESGQMSYEMREMDYPSLLSDVFEQVEPNGAASGIKVTLDVVAGIPEVTGDRDRLRQVLLNLLNNAMQFTAAGGSVAIHAHHDAANRTVVTTVSDTGTGIPEEDLPKIFDRFFKSGRRQSGKAGGTGLGLAISRHIVDSHGGSIWAESETGKGSTFTFTIPA
jgi:two-component system, OmpR family, sensor histidine kinase ResE